MSIEDMRKEFESALAEANQRINRLIVCLEGHSETILDLTREIRFLISFCCF